MAMRYGSPDEIDETMRWLMDASRALGATGNFIIGVHEVDFYYSRTGTTFSFTYSRGSWMYWVSGPSDDDVQAFVSAFPY
jgi:hypothetical protein